MIVLTGATGHFGHAALDALLQKGVAATDIRALVRNEAAAAKFQTRGIETAIGDYDDYGSLVKAFTGADKLLFISGSDLGKRLSQHHNVIAAAQEAGVKHVVYTSFQRRNETESSPLWIVAESHIATEKELKQSGLAYTILRNNLYLDFLPGFIGENVLETGVIYVPAEKGRVGAVLRAEMAEAAATVLSTTGHENREYDFTNTEAVSYDEIAQTISDASGKAIRYHSPAVDDYIQTLTGFGVPAEVVGIFSSFAIAQAQGELDATSDDLTRLLGRKPISIREFISRLYTQS